MKNIDKYVYVVRGSESGIKSCGWDENLGVYSTIKLAYECAEDYVKNEDKKHKKSYSLICKEFRNRAIVDIIKDWNYSSINARIERFKELRVFFRACGVKEGK
tara:strand:+ start:931 stop:1239 length:309 start_codon:yes stop_codon:yes gene_type:complete